MKVLWASAYVMALLGLYLAPGLLHPLVTTPAAICGGASAAVVQQRTLQVLSAWGQPSDRAIETARLWSGRCR